MLTLEAIHNQDKVKTKTLHWKKWKGAKKWIMIGWQKHGGIPGTTVSKQKGEGPGCISWTLLALL